MPTGKMPTGEIADYIGKVTLVPDLSYLFSAGTNLNLILNISKISTLNILLPLKLIFINFLQHKTQKQSQKQSINYRWKEIRTTEQNTLNT